MVIVRRYLAFKHAFFSFFISPRTIENTRLNTLRKESLDFFA